MRKYLLLNLIFFLLILSVYSVFGNNNSLKNKNTGEISYKIGNQYFEKKNYNEVIKFYEQAISEGYENNDMYYELSICYQEIKKYSESMYYLEKAIEILENTVKKNI